MPNVNTVSRLQGGGTPIQGVNAIPSVVPASTAAFVVLNQAATAAFLTVGNSNVQPTGAQTYGSGFDGFPFRLRVAWKVTTKAACNLTIAVQQATTTTTTVTGGNTVMTTGAISNGTGNFNGFIEGTFLWDSTQQKISGYFMGNVGATTPAIIDLTTCSNAVAVTTQAGLNFEIVATFSDTTAGTTLTITEFVAEVL